MAEQPAETDERRGDDRRAGDRRNADRRGNTIESRSVQQDQFIFRENETGDLAFVVKSGTVQISKSEGESEVVLGHVGAGGMFGEMALIDDSPRMASAKAVNGSVELMVISRKMFERKLDTMDPFTRGLIDILASHIRTLAASIAKSKLPAS